MSRSRTRPKRKVNLVILRSERQRGAILLDGFGKFPGVLERKSCQKSRAAFRRLQFRGVTKCLRGRGRVAVHQHQAKIQVRGGHFRVQRDRAGKFGFRILRTLQSRIRIAKLKMRVGIVGTLRDVFLKRLQRRREIHFVDRVFRLLQQRRERIFLFA